RRQRGTSDRDLREDLGDRLEIARDHDAAARGSADAEEVAAGDGGGLGDHRAPPSTRAAEPVGRAPRDAALWMASRIRTYVPHRQMLPFIALSMSASVGFAIVARSAAADIICPAWQ